MSNINLSKDTEQFWCVETALGNHILSYLKGLKEVVEQDCGIPVIYIEKASIEKYGRVTENVYYNTPDELISRAEEIRREVIDELIWTFTNHDCDNSDNTLPELPPNAYVITDKGIVRNFDDSVYQEYQRKMEEHKKRKLNGLKLFAEFYYSLEV